MAHSEAVNQFKILTIGESGVGKTCILRRFVDNKFQKAFLSTIGIDYKTKDVQLGGNNVKLKIWDTAGQDRFRNITQQYYKGADGIALIFDLTDKSSFEKITDWVTQINEKTNCRSGDIAMILFGNKCDCEERVVSLEESQKMARELNVEYYETSAWTGKNIKEGFERLTHLMIDKKGIDWNEQKDIVTLDKKKQQTSNSNKGCC